jgi:hypothetical protein
MIISFHQDRLRANTTRENFGVKARPPLFVQIVLMSATLNAELFSGYFTTPGGPSPAIHIPGFTHPVTEVKNGLFAPFILIYRNALLTKTGSGQT